MDFFITLFNFISLFLKSVSPEDSEKRRTNYQAYRSYLNREGPKALGSKEIPKVRVVRGPATLSGPLACGPRMYSLCRQQQEIHSYN